jgi:hypothetical protein
MGSIRQSGWWYYFPAAMLFKTATATLLAALLAPFAFVLSRVWLKDGTDTGTRNDSDVRWRYNAWAITCLIVPAGLYFITALFTNLNLGLRHILPVYPFVYVAIGCIFSLLWRARKLVAKMVGGVIAGGLLLETLLAYPNYLAFFNAPSGGSHGGIKLLGDSNLDWGQDLPALAQWQRTHPSQRIYLCYFGMANPASYRLDYVNLIGGYPLQPFNNSLSDPGVVAVSATNVQGIYTGPTLLKEYQDLLHHEEPMEILNGTIYLYRWPPDPEPVAAPIANQ